MRRSAWPRRRWRRRTCEWVTVTDLHLCPFKAVACGRNLARSPYNSHEVWVLSHLHARSGRSTPHPCTTPSPQGRLRPRRLPSCLRACDYWVKPLWILKLQRRSGKGTRRVGNGSQIRGKRGGYGTLPYLQCRKFRAVQTHACTRRQTSVIPSAPESSSVLQWCPTRRAYSVAPCRLPGLRRGLGIRPPPAPGEARQHRCTATKAQFHLQL